MKKVAVVGAGAFGKNHVRVVSESSRAELAFVVDPNLALAREHAGPRGAQALESHRELVGRVDAAVIAAPTIHHASIACDLMEAGIDVLVEKPIAVTVTEADRMIEVAERQGRILQVERVHEGVLVFPADVLNCVGRSLPPFALPPRGQLEG